MHTTSVFFPKALAALAASLCLSNISLQAQVDIPPSAAVGPATRFVGGSLKGEYWHRGVNSIFTDGTSVPEHRVDTQIRGFGPADGTFTATSFVYLGNDLTAIRTWLGSDAATYSGINSNLDDGAIRFSGYINVAAAGTLALGTTSDDGSRITIAGIDIIANDGSHGDATVDADVNFAAAGLYPIEITFFAGDWTSDTAPGGLANHSGSTDPSVHGGDNFHLRVGRADITPAGTALLFATAPPQIVRRTLLTPSGTAWAYNDQTATPGLTGAWTTGGYDTNSEPGWQTGNSLFGNDAAGIYDAGGQPFAGVGLNGFSTPLDRWLSADNSGNADRITFYFRTKFNWSGATAGVSLTASNWIDDGIVVYLNGTEISRLRMPAAPAAITWDTTGSNPGTEGLVEVQTWDASPLVNGENTLAVELHQSSANSSDCAMAIGLVAQLPLSPAIVDPNQPTNRNVFANRDTTLIVDAIGSPTPTYQWYHNGSPIDPGVNPSATTPTLSIVNMQAVDGGTYFARVANVVGSVDSRTATVTYVNDTNPPVIIEAAGSATFDRISLLFDGPVRTGGSEAASDPFTYGVDGGLNVLSANASADGRSVVLLLDAPPMSPDTVYTVSINGDIQDLAGNSMAPNTTVSFRSWVVGGGCAGATFEAYNVGGGNAVSALTGHPTYPNSPDFRTIINAVDIRVAMDPSNPTFYNTDAREAYGGRIRGYFLASESGPHTFWYATDDNGEFWLSTDEFPSHKVLVARETVWSNTKEWTISGGSSSLEAKRGTVSLVAGHAYYFEALYKEGGGGDNCAVAVQPPSQADPPVNGMDAIGATYLGSAAPPNILGPLSVAQQPSNLTVDENATATFTVGANAPTFDGLMVPVCYQWRSNGVVIAGANGPSYSFGPVSAVADGSSFDCALAIIGASATSASAILHVNTDVTPPLVIRSFGSSSLTNATIEFNELLDPTTAMDAFNYAISGGLGVNGARLNPDGKSVTLATDPQTIDTEYTLTINTVADLAGNPILPNTTSRFHSFVISCGFALQEIYRDIGSGVNISDLEASPKYPGSPDQVRYVGALSANDADEFDSYGTRISGWILPPISGDYVFYLASDDGGDFWLSTDDNPVHLVQVAREPVWAARRNYIGEANGGGRLGVPSPNGGPQANITAPIPLVAGQRYYFQARMKEGGGGDNLDVAWQIPGGPAPVSGSAPLSGAFLAALADPTGAAITFTQQPADITVPGCDGPACFSVAVTAVNSSGNNPAVFYQWERSDDGGATYRSVLGANSAQFCLTPTPSEDGAKFRVRIYILGATATSAAATLTVTADPVRPQIVSATRGASPHNIVKVTFSESVDAASANNAANYGIDHGVGVTGAALASDGQTVVLTTAADLNDGTCYTLTVGAVIDRCANPANTQAKIILQGGHVPAPGDPNNMIVIEAEDFDGQVPARGRSWVFGNTSGGGGFSGTGYVADLPDGGATVGDTDLDAERVDYLVNLPVAGTWYVWARARSPGGLGNSCHIGIDGTRPTTGYRFGNSAGWNGDTWQWDFGLNDSAATLGGFTVATAGLHTFNIWSREDGLQIDKILLIPVAGIPPGTDLSRLATVLGPAATPREISIPPPTVSITSPSDGATLPACEPATICADPRVCDSSSSIVSVAFFANGQPVGVATSTPWCITVPAAAVRPGSYTLTATATDTHGLMGNAAPVLVHVADAPPVITCPADLTVRATDASGAIVPYIAGATDVCGLRSFDCQPPSGSLFLIGMTTVLCTAVDTAGNSASCSFKVTVLASNLPPTAVISTEQLVNIPGFDHPVLISCNWWNACLIADGWTSSDPEGGALTYLWFLVPDPVPFAAGPLVTNCLEVGLHAVALVVTDPGGLTDTDSKTIEVVTAPLGIELLIEDINSGSLKSVIPRKIKRELTETLRVALAFSKDNKLRQTQQALDAFEKKVRAQVAPNYPAEATKWIRWSQAVSEGMEKCIKPPRKHGDDDNKKDTPPRK